MHNTESKQFLFSFINRTWIVTCSSSIFPQCLNLSYVLMMLGCSKSEASKCYPAESLMPPTNTHTHQETHNQKTASVSMSLAPVIPNISIHPISSVNTKSLKDKLKDLIKDARLQRLDRISTRSYSESSSGYRWPRGELN